ncbi:MAG: universal stress protein [Acidaminococcaceae bacterium]
MSNFSKVMLATDFSESSGRLGACLFELCPDTATEVVLVHVLDDDEDADPHSSSYQAAWCKLKKCETELKQAGYEALTLVMPKGEPFAEINRIASEENITLAFLASHGKGFIRSTLLGSTTFDLARKANYPLFIEKLYKETEKNVPLLTRVMVPTDFSKESLVALNILRELREELGEVVFVHVVEKSRDSDELTEQLQQAESKLNELVEELKNFGVTATIRVTKGTPSKRLQRIAGEMDATLIIMAKTGAGPVKGLMMGSTAQNVALNSNRPILLLPLDDEN